MIYNKPFFCILTSINIKMISRLKTHTIVLFCSLYFAGGAHAQTLPVEKTELSEQTKSFQEYLTADGKKAFAISDNGAYAFSSKQKLDEHALRLALARCQKLAAMSCHITHLNGDAFEAKYQNHAKASQAALNNLKIVGNDYKVIEAMNWHISAPTQLRSTEEGIHFPTPLQLNGIVTINTDDLVEKIKDRNLILIDTRYINDEPDTSLPGAHLFDYAGLAPGDKNTEEKMLRTFANLMKQIAPNKTQAIAVFCQSVECWLSVNAAMRLQSLGYTNLYWYRGGVHAWKLAKLPTVQAVPFATLRAL